MLIPISPEGVEAFRALAATLRELSQQMGEKTSTLNTVLQEKRNGLGEFAEKIEDNVCIVANIVREQGSVIELLAQACEKIAAKIEAALVMLAPPGGGGTSDASTPTQSSPNPAKSKEMARSGLSMRGVAAMGLAAGYLVAMGMTPPNNSAAADFRENVQESYERTLETLEKREEANDDGTLSSLQKDGVSGDPPEGYGSVNKVLEDLGVVLPNGFIDGEGDVSANTADSDVATAASTEAVDIHPVIVTSPSVKADLDVQYRDEYGNPDWMTETYPQGFAEDPPPQRIVLQPGRYTRYGGTTGHYLAPLGTPFEKLGLPYEYDRSLDTVVELKEPIEVTAGAVQPNFGSTPGGIQYVTDKPLCAYNIDVFIGGGKQ